MNKKIRIVLTIILCIIFFSSLAFLLQILLGYHMTDKLYEESASKFTVKTGKEDSSEDMGEKTAESVPITVDFAALQSVNSDVVGWIYCEGTDINYPVLQGEDNDFYLSHTYDRTENRAGSIFVEALNTPGFADSNTIIYGHHMKSGQMFGQLQKYAKESYGEKHSIIRFDSIYEEAEYQVMYVFRSQVYNEDEFVFKYYQFIDANSEEEFNSYMEEMAGLSLYDTGVTASYGDSLLTLSTCDNSQTDGRFVVVAKRIK